MVDMESLKLPRFLLRDFKAKLPSDLAKRFRALNESPYSTRSFSFYASVSAIASSKIEGEPLEVDSFVKHRMLKTKYLPELVRKPDDLYAAYLLAQSHPLTPKRFLQAHRKITAHLLPVAAQGVLRKTEMVVMQHGAQRIQYEAAPAGVVPELYASMWGDIRELQKANLGIKQAFFYASLIHLVFVNIHPFEDGNGRAARLLEKWFLSEKLGEKAWFLQSDLHYYHNADRYYKNLNRLGMFFEELNYGKALPFLSMLPQSLKTK